MDDCIELVPATQKPPRHLLDVMRDYLHEHVIPTGSDPKRVIIVARHLVNHFWDEPYPALWKRSHSRGYIAMRRALGISNASIRRELSIGAAAIRHDVREERIKEAPQFELPPQGEPRKRFLTDDEIKALFKQPLSRRLRMFFRLALATAARSQAIEQLTWTRVDMEQGLIDFRVPGMRLTKKRRAVVPISDELRRYLEAAYLWPNRDEFVIGAGPTTYHEAKKFMRAIGIDEKGVARHVARKTFASHALLAGVPLAHVAAVLGDTQATTERAYSFILAKDLGAAVNFREAA